MWKILTTVRKFFYLTPRDLGVQIGTVEEIAEGMKKTDEPQKNLPWEFASAMSKIINGDFDKKTKQL